MGAKLKKIIKIVAGVLAGLALLNLFCYWYYNPVGYLQDESRATDVIREPGLFTSRANEGFSWAVIDANGYNNREVPDAKGVYILMMGSSHTEGLYVMPGEDVSSQLSEQLAEHGVDGKVYNIGTSAHHLSRNVMNLDRALTRFEPSGYVVIETQSVMIYPTHMYGALDGSLERIAATQVVINPWLSKQPLLRTVYRQLLTLSGAEEEEAEPKMIEITPEVLRLYLEGMTQLFQMVRDAADAHGVTPIIYYQPTLLLQPDGSVKPDTEPRLLKVFAEACAAAGVRFMDMTDAFLKAYAQDYTLPHGFINTAPGVGHLNAKGNRIIAEELCAEIVREEAEK